MTGLLVFFVSTINKVLAGLIFSVFVCVAYMHFRPFIADDDDNLANVCQLSIFFTIFSALLIHVHVDETDGYDSSAFGAILVAVNVFAIALVLLDFFTVSRFEPNSHTRPHLDLKVLNLPDPPTHHPPTPPHFTPTPLARSHSDR